MTLDVLHWGAGKKNWSMYGRHGSVNFRAWRCESRPSLGLSFTAGTAKNIWDSTQEPSTFEASHGVEMEGLGLSSVILDMIIRGLHTHWAPTPGLSSVKLTPNTPNAVSAV